MSSSKVSFHFQNGLFVSYSHDIYFHSGLWQERIERVFEHLTHHSIRPQVEKVVKVLDSRAIFPKDAIQRLKATLENAKSQHKGKNKHKYKQNVNTLL